MQPLERLLRGIERTQRGDLTVQVPIHSNGEIATITRTFNRLVASQRNLLENLETQVRERTQLLETTNQELQSEIQLRRQVQLDLEELNRELDARVQERTHELSQSEERFRRVVTSISDQVYAVTIDPLTRAVGVDYLSSDLKAMLGIQGTDGADLLVRLRTKHVAQEDLANFDAHIANLFQGCDSKVDYRFMMLDGTPKWVRASVRCERVSPAQIRCYGVISDISDRKQLEQETATRMALQEVDQLRNAWLSNMSHELRTPLGLIKAAATTLLATDVTIPPSMQQPILEQLDYETDRLTDLVNALLDLSRVDAGRLHLTYSETDVVGILREVCATATLQMRIGALPPFTLELVTDPPTQVAVVDRERIKRVLQNLLSNAMKFAPDDSLITLRAHASAAHICIEVEDHGIGIDATDQERIFERYYQVDNPGLRSHNGVGIGLPICREIVAAHGGTISLKSQKAGVGLASGTTITVCVPRTPPAGRKG
jgi:signal transduction histidine kinase